MRKRFLDGRIERSKVVKGGTKGTASTIESLLVSLADAQRDLVNAELSVKTIKRDIDLKKSMIRSRICG